MSFDHRLWLSTGSTLSPMILVFRLSKSGLSFAMYPSSVLHTGVKSFGCENSTAQELPSHSWKRIRPSVVSARNLERDRQSEEPSHTSSWHPNMDSITPLRAARSRAGGRR